MSDQIRQSDLRNDNAAIMRRVARGESFVVTVNGRPVADLVPHQRESSRRRFVPVQAMAQAMADLPAIDTRAWASETETADELFGHDAVEDPWQHGTPQGPT